MQNRAPSSYGVKEQARYRQDVSRRLDEKATTNELFLLSPNGAQWRLVVDDTGALTTTQVLRVP